MTAPQEPIAVIGIACRFPRGADTPGKFWSLLRNGVDAISEIPSDRFDVERVFDADPTQPGKLYARWGGFVDGIDRFDAGFFGISPREAARIDPQHRLLLEVAWEAMEDAGVPADRLAGTPVGVFVGISTHDYGDIQTYPAHRLAIDAHTNTGTATSIAANRISYLYDLRGPSLTVDTACSSSLTAVHIACQSLRGGECELALVGGVQVLLVPELTIGFCKATMLSPDGHCKAFDASANGYVRSEGGGMVLLKPLTRAVQDGDRIYAVIRGSALNQDGHTNGMTVPSSIAQAEMVRTALRNAGLAPREVQYVEAHGTGTPVGDPIEATALGTALAHGRTAADPSCAIGSVKTNIGHLEAAAGMAGLIKTLLALSHGEIPPSLHFVNPNPSIDFDGLRLRVVTALEQWPTGDGELGAAGVSSFGFGGSNAHVILQEAPRLTTVVNAEQHSRARPELLVLSARSAEALRAQASRYRELIAEHDNIGEVCAAAALTRAHLEHRMGVVGASSAEIVEGLEAFLAGDTRANVAANRVSADGSPKLAFVFSGMGPQWWAMGRQLLGSEPAFRDVVLECDALLRPYAGFSLLEELTRDEATSRVGEADLAQMTNFAIQVGLVALWESWGIRPDAVIGHSAGEMAAAYTAGALDLEESVWLAYHRSRLQSRATGKGRMLAVGLPAAEIVELLAQYEGTVELAAINSPSSATLSGDAEALESLMQTLQDRQVFARLLPVEVPYHSRYMDEIGDELVESLDRLAPQGTRVPMVSVVTGAWVDGPDLGSGYWWRNVRQPVQFAHGMEQLADANFSTFLEVGPHPVLGVSVAECMAARGIRANTLASLRRMEDERASLLRALSALHCQGHAVRWDALYPRSTNASVRLPTYPWQRERHWLDLAVTAAEHVTPATSQQPLLGRRVRGPRPVWEVGLVDNRLDYLNDHVVQDAKVFPAAAYLEMALSATRGSDESVVLHDVAFERALIIDRREDTLLQISVDEDRGRWEIHSRTGDGNWTRHASGRVEPRESTPAHMDLDALRGECTTELRRDEFYDMLHRRRLQLQGPFQALEQMWVGEREALASIELPVECDPGGYSIHPILVDAALQSLVAAAVGPDLQADKGGLFLPVGIGRLLMVGQPTSRRAWAHAILRSAPGEPPAGDVTLMDETGNVLLQVDGLRCRLLDHGADRLLDSLNDWLYQYVWEPASLPSANDTLSRIADVDLTPLVHRLTLAAEERSTAWNWREYYGRAEQRLNELACTYIADCVSELGWSASVPQSADALAVVPGQKRLFSRLVEGLQSSGAVAAVKTDDLLAELPDYEAEVRLITHCGEHLIEVLRGDVDAREVLFSTEAMGLVARLYRDSAPSRVFNTLTAESVAALSAGATNNRARILEIGAGTGGTTAYVLPNLPPGSFDYTFTDISPVFVDAAPSHSGSVDGFAARTLDIEKAPSTQGFAPHAYDVIVASNVLHATADLRPVLQHVQDLLAPGGVLVLQEITRQPLWLDLIFGLTDGWWRFTDYDLRPAHPLLDVTQWTSLLESRGFQDVLPMGDALSAGSSAQAVVLARAPARAPAVHPTAHWIVIGDADGVGARVAEELTQRGQSCTAVSPTAESSLQATFEALGPQLENVHGVVDLRSLEVPAVGANTPAEAVLDQNVDACVEALGVLNAIAAEPRLTCGLTIVTAGSQPVDGRPGDGGLAFGQTAVWGLARVAMREQPRTRCRLVDLDPSVDRDTMLNSLVDELLAGATGAREEEVAFRGAERLRRRLRRVAVGSLEPRVVSRPREADEAYRATIHTAGVLESLQLTPAMRRAPAHGEVEIQVEAASLNFRDIMFAMGLLSPLATEGTFGRRELGFDCAGVVTSCGAGVTHVQTGDAVIGIGAGTLASHVTTSAELLALRPSGVDGEAGSTLLCAFVTAEYALRHLARLQAGERVLIHSATGGVGLAALQVARSVGAEVFATAGNQDKRDYLVSLGVRHVMDSRTLRFADEIFQATGGEGVDVVLNSLSGEAIEKGLSVLRPYGRFVEIGKRDIYENSGIGLLAFRKNQSFLALDLDRLCAERPALVGSLIRDVAARVESGEYQPLLHTSFPISRLEDAMRYMAQARHMGKVVLSMDDPDVKLTSGTRNEPLFRSDGTYLITGGLGGFGTATAEWMASHGAGTLVLIGRTGTSPGAEPPIERIRARGSRVEIRRADVSDEHALSPLLREIRSELSPIRGIIHAAMVLDDAPLDQLDRERLEHVMAPKLAGAWNLHRLTDEDPLDCFVLFSSIASLLGNPLQANYAAANASFGPLAHHRRAVGRPALCVDWGVLSGVGYLSNRPDVADHLARQGYLGFDADQALGALEYLMRAEVAQVMVARMDWRRWARSSPTAATAPHLLEFAVVDESGSTGLDSSEASKSLRKLASAAPTERRELMTGFLRERVARILGTAPTRLDLDARLAELGFDSLMAVELTTVLKTELGVELGVVKLLQDTSLQGLADLVLPELNLSDKLENAVAGSPDSRGSAAAGASPPAGAAGASGVAAASGASGVFGESVASVASVSGPIQSQVAAQESVPQVTTDYRALDYTQWTRAQRLARLGLTAAWRVLTDIDVEGLENLPSSGPYLLAANHISLLDAPLVLTTLPRRTVVFAGERLRDHRLFNFVLSDLFNAIYIRRGAGDVEALALGMQVLQSGGVLGVGPEGGISPGGALSAGHTGIAYLATQADVPVVPIAAWGQEKVTSEWRRRRRPAVHVRIGVPLRFAPGNVDGLHLRAYTDEVMRAIAELLPPEYRGAYAAKA
jgi:1-acyl-sn-glycerol-3-phosphate acyltransferase